MPPEATEAADLAHMRTSTAGRGSLVVIVCLWSVFLTLLWAKVLPYEGSVRTIGWIGLVIASARVVGQRVYDARH